MDLLHWRSLTEAVRNIQIPGNLLLEKVFTRVRKFPTNQIDVDIILGNKKMVPFVTPIEGGVVVSKLGRSVRSVTAPRLRPKVGLDPMDFNERAAGSSVFVSEEDRKRYQKEKIALEQLNLKNQCLRRIHWMCAQSLTGKIAVDQENVSFEIDFKVPDTNKPVLTNGADGDFKWDGDDAAILENIRAWKRLGANAGYNLRLGISTPSATDAMLKNDEIKKLLDLRNVNIGQITLDGMDYIGRICGVDIFEFAEEYVDENGRSYPMLPDGTFTMLDPDARFDLNFGAVQDLDAGGNVVTDFFSKSWTEKDPSCLWLLVETDPLPTVNEPGALVHATVL